MKKPGDKDAEPSPKKPARGQSLKPSLGTPEPSHSPSPRPPPPPLPQPSQHSLPINTMRSDISPRKERPRPSNAGMSGYVICVIVYKFYHSSL